MSQTTTPSEMEPSRPETLTVVYLEEAGHLVIHKKRGCGSYWFLLLWLTGWTVGCIVLAVNIFSDPSLILFAIPFWASWLVVASIVVWMRFGKETLIVGPDEVRFQRTAWIKLSTRVVPRAEVQSFQECRSSYTENDQYLWGIEMVTTGKPLRFAFRLPDRERAWLIHQLNRFIGSTGSGLEQPLSAQPFMQRTGVVTAGPTARPLTYEETRPNPPFDCRWHMTEDFDDWIIERRGRLEWIAILGLLFINAFWNGIVSVFVLLLWGILPVNNAPQGWEWWGMFVFLIPFEVIGLAMFAALLMAFLEPFHEVTWRFERDTIGFTNRWPLIRRSKTWAMPDRVSLELRREAPENASASVASVLGDSPARQLTFVSPDKVDIVTINSLTEGEALWMARLVLDRRPQWFQL